MRSEATVYRLTDTGYVMAQEGSNGFSCLTRQEGVTPTPFHGAFMSVCYDTEGAQTLMQSDLMQARLFAQNKTHAEVGKIIDDAWARGELKRPGPGLAYMLSPVQHIRPYGGPPSSYVPHLMFYTTGQTNADVRGDAPPNPMGYEPYMASPGKPWAMTIVPMAPEIRAKLAEEHQALINDIQPYIDKKVALAKGNP